MKKQTQKNDQKTQISNLKIWMVFSILLCSLSISAQWTGSSQLIPRLPTDKVGIGTAAPNTNTYLHLYHEDCNPSYTNLLRLSKFANNAGVSEIGGQLFFDFSPIPTLGGGFGGGFGGGSISSHTLFDKIEGMTSYQDAQSALPVCLTKIHWDIDINPLSSSLYFRNVIEDMNTGNNILNKDVMILTNNNVTIKPELIAHDFVSTNSTITNATIQNATVTNFLGTPNFQKLSIGNLKASGTYNNYALSVDGSIVSKKAIVQISNWADKVFDKKYKLMSLKDIESYIQTNKHLPELPSEAEVVENGIDVGEMQKLQMQKIEELTLHLIEQEKKIEALEKKIGFTSK